MSEKLATTKGTIWKYFGAMMMEDKNGQQAMSYTRCLGLVLFLACLCIWLMATFMTAEKGAPPMDVPPGMLTTLYGLIGIKGAKDVAGAFKGGK